MLLWLTVITEHRTGEAKVYLFAVKDVSSNRIVGHSISDRMKSRIAVDALAMAVARRQNLTGRIAHSDGAVNSGPGSTWPPQLGHDLTGS